MWFFSHQDKELQYIFPSVLQWHLQSQETYKQLWGDVRKYLFTPVWGDAWSKLSSKSSPLSSAGVWWGLIISVVDRLIKLTQRECRDKLAHSETFADFLIRVEMLSACTCICRIAWPLTDFLFFEKVERCRLQSYCREISCAIPSCNTSPPCKAEE